jgi:Na+/phosphate symporter
MSKQEVLAKFEQQKTQHLIASLAIDAVGMCSYLIPALAELSDVIIAPISALAVFALYRTPMGAIANFTEEILPVTDVIPTATILWYNKYQRNKEKALRDFVDKVRQDADVERSVFDESDTRRLN